jgi:hypothetical protein
VPNTWPNPRVTGNKEFVQDIRSGMTALVMNEKYGLKVRDSDRVMEYLIDAGLITNGGTFRAPTTFRQSDNTSLHSDE